MSIPTPFNPMGTLGRELPYPQVVLQSNTQGTTESGGALPHAFVGVSSDTYPINTYRAFDAKTDTNVILLSWLEINFGQPVTIKEVSTLARMGGYGQREEGYLQYLNELSNWVTVSDKLIFGGYEGTGIWDTKPAKILATSNRWRIKVTTGAVIYEVRYTATYKQ